MGSLLDKLKQGLAGLAGKGEAPPDPAEYAPERADALAAEMTDQQRVQWAAESARSVGDKLSPEDIKALEAAEAWQADPTPEAAEAAGKAAAEAGHAGPGAWSAQAAAWAQPAGETAGASAGAAATATTPPLAAQAASGAVKMAAGMAAGQSPSTPTPEETLAAAGEAADTAEPADQTPLTDEQKQQNAAALKPFIDRGREIHGSGPAVA